MERNEKKERLIDDSKWPPNKIANRGPVVPHGYKKKEGDPKSLVRDDAAVLLIEQGFDHLDSGLSLREVSRWISQETGRTISAMGLRKIWFEKRDNVETSVGKRRLAERKSRMPQNREERKVYTKKKKIAALKRHRTNAKKKLEKLQAEFNEEQTVKQPSAHYELAPDIEIQQDIIFQPNPGPQTEFLSAPEREVLYGGAAGGGKSYALLADPMRYFHNKNFNGLLLRRTNDELRELVWKSQELYPKAFPGAKWSEKKSSWTFPAGGHLWLTYLERDDDVLRYQGQAFTWIAFDELTQYSAPFSWNYLRSRLRTSDTTLDLCMRGTTNPGGPGHGWVKRMFIDPAPPNTPFPATDIENGQTLVFPEGHEKAGQPLFYRRFIPARVQDNPYLWEDGQYEANLLSLPEAQRRQLLDGDWGVADGAAFPEFRTNIHTCRPFTIRPEWKRFRSCDYGYSSYAAVHWYAIDPAYDTLYVYRELYVSKKTGKELARMVLDLERGERILYGVLDSSVWAKRGETGPSIAEEMLVEGCRWRPSDRSQGSRVNSKNRLHELLKVDPDTGKPGIIFFDTCRQIISDLPVLPSDPNGGDDIDDRYKSDHAYDSIRYGIMTRPRGSSMFDDWGKNKTTVQGYQPLDKTFGY